MHEIAGETNGSRLIRWVSGKQLPIECVRLVVALLVGLDSRQLDLCSAVVWLLIEYLDEQALGLGIFSRRQIRPAQLQLQGSFSRILPQCGPQNLNRLGIAPPEHRGLGASQNSFYFRRSIRRLLLFLIGRLRVAK